MGEAFDIEAIREAITRHMARKKIKRKPLAKAAGLGETAIRDIFNPERNDVRVSTLVKLAEYFETTVDEMTGRDPVHLLGKVGAGGAILFEETDEPELVPRPAFTPGKLMALQVVGDSMMPKYEAGDVIYVRRDHQGVLEEYVGQYCVVHTVEGGTFLKILAHGSRTGLYTLRSLNAADMVDVEVVWASPVESVMPRQALEKWKTRQQKV
jgi:SOS-response transcriptional repressor LexA